MKITYNNLILDGNQPVIINSNDLGLSVTVKFNSGTSLVKYNNVTKLETLCDTKHTYITSEVHNNGTVLTHANIADISIELETENKNEF